MIDSVYFQTHLPAQIQEMGSGSTTVVIHLTTGGVLKVRHIGLVEEGYVLLEVFPPDGVTKKSKAERRKAGGTNEVIFDRVAIPYGSISYVLLIVKNPRNAAMIGFYSELSE